MKLLLDQNLSRFLLTRLGASFAGSAHVLDVGLDQATDREIWDWAGANGFTIVSKDSDFRDLAAVLGPLPKAIWLRVGNASTDAIEYVLRDHVAVILNFDASGETALLVIQSDDSDF